MARNYALAYETTKTLRSVSPWFRYFMQENIRREQQEEFQRAYREGGYSGPLEAEEASPVAIARSAGNRRLN